MKKPKVELSLNSQNYLAEQMSKRAVRAGPFHTLVYLILFLRVPGLIEQAWPWMILMGMAAASALRFVIVHFVKDLVAHPETRRLWRVCFAFTSFLFAIGWATYAVTLLETQGLNAHSVTAMIAACGIVAAAVPSFSYDLPVLIGFVLITLLPITISTAIVADIAASGMFPGLLVYTFFMVLLSIRMHRFETTSIHQIETIREHKTRLETMNSTMTTMVDSLDEAFLLIDEQGMFRPTNSKRAHDLFGCNPSGRYLHEILKMPVQDQPMVKDWLSLAFRNQMDFKDLSALGPSRYHDSERGIDVSLRYRAMNNKNGELESIVLLAQDVSREIGAERAAKSNVARAEMIIQALHNPKAFSDFIENTETLIEKMRDGAYRADNELRHDLHTLKGAAMMFRAEGLAEQIYLCEFKLREQGETADISALGQDLVDFFAGWKLVEDDFIRLLTQVGGKEKVKRTLHSYLQNFSAAVAATAKELNKSVRLEVLPSQDEVVLNEKHIPTILHTLIHLFNNAVDHGMEMPAVREQKGKPQQGRITVATAVFSKGGAPFVRILVSDDGQGIDAGAVKEALLRRGATDLPDEPLTLYQRIFDDGISSRQHITRVSGHGVGLGAIKAAAQDCGGSVRVLKSDDQGTEFEVVIPLSAFRPQKRAAA